MIKMSISIMSFSDSTIVLVVLIVLLLLNNWLFNKISKGKEINHLVKLLVILMVLFIGGVLIVLTLPVELALKGQILSFLGIVIMATIALSSGSILGNIMAGIMNNSMKRFHNGDLIKVGDLVGRVTKTGIFHTEIQLEDSNFITIPNIYMISNPVKLTRKTKSVICTCVSLGYDVSKKRIKDSLLKAAEDTGLNNPYVYIAALNDFSVTYKIHGFLEDSGKYFSTISLLNEHVLDRLHDEGIEIVSPAFMNQRRVEDRLFIPKKNIQQEELAVVKSPEELIFDKAIAAEELEKKKEYLLSIEDKIAQMKEEQKMQEKTADIANYKKTILMLEGMKTRLEEHIREKEKE